MASRSLNLVQLIGNLTRDPELRYIPQGTAVCSFSIATNRSWVPADGSERREETEYHRIVAWNKLAELCSQLLSKGRKVYVSGRLQTRQWETPDGQNRERTEVVIDDMIILDRRVQDAPRVAEAVTSDVTQTSAAQAGDDIQAPATATSQTSPSTSTVSDGDEGKGKETKKANAETDIVDIDDIPF